MHNDTYVSGRFLSKNAVIATLRQAGLTSETIASLQRELRDPVDLDGEGGNLLFAHGLTLDRLTDWFGGSP